MPPPPSSPPSAQYEFFTHYEQAWDARSISTPSSSLPSTDLPAAPNPDDGLADDPGADPHGYYSEPPICVRSASYIDESAAARAARAAKKTASKGQTEKLQAWEAACSGLLLWADPEERLRVWNLGVLRAREEEEEGRGLLPLPPFLPQKQQQKRGSEGRGEGWSRFAFGEPEDRWKELEWECRYGPLGGRAKNSVEERRRVKNFGRDGDEGGKKGFERGLRPLRGLVRIVWPGWCRGSRRV